MCRFSRILTGITLAGLAGANSVTAEPSLTQEPSPEVVSSSVLTVLPVHPESESAARTSPIPEPVSLAVFGTGIVLLLRRRRRG